MKRNLLLISIITIMFNSLSAASEPYGTGLLNSQHMKQFNMFERGIKPPQFLTNFQKDKTYTINNIVFEKNEAIPTDILQEIITFSPGSKLSEKELLNMKNDISEFYHSNGYKSAIINYATKKDTAGTIFFTIYEGPKEKINPDDLTKEVP